MTTMEYGKNIAIIGTSGAIGTAFVTHLAKKDGINTIYAFSRSEKLFSSSKVRAHSIDIEDEMHIQSAANHVDDDVPLDMVIVASGLLHDQLMMPEKALRDLSYEKFHKLLLINTIGPSLIAKHFIPKLHHKKRAIFAALSARVGSISDNRLGGWYAYRASKAALNMVIKNLSIEMSRKSKDMIIVGLHPGTVDSGLSKPFQDNVPQGKLFTADYSTLQLLDVLNKLSPHDTGKCFAWDGQEVSP